MTFDLVSALSPTVTDADERAEFLADPRAALAKAGLDVPAWMDVTVAEGNTPALSITLPPLLAPDELAEMHLDDAAGAYYTFCRPSTCYD